MEHCIQFLKGEGGSKGLYGNQEQRDLAKISRPLLLEAIKKFEKEEIGIDSDIKIQEHPECTNAQQEKFKKDLTALISLVEDDKVLNPFCELSGDLVTIDTGEVMDPLIAQCMYDLEEIGQ